jgi:flagellar biosynthesis/type III secretory pathway protein FliH
MSLSNSFSDQADQFTLWQSFDSPADPGPGDTFPRSKSGSSNGEGEHGFQTFSPAQSDTAQKDGFISLYQPPSNTTFNDALDPRKDPIEEKAAPNDEANDSSREGTAYEEGFAKGEQDGLEAGRQKIARVLLQINELVTGVENLWPDLIQKYEKQIIDLVFKASEKLLLGQIAADPEVVKRSILHAFELIPDPVEMTLEVNPEDYEFIETVKVDFFDQIKSLKHVTVISDPSVSRGGCRVNTPKGQVNATLEARLDAVRRSVASSAGHHAEAKAEVE